MNRTGIFIKIYIHLKSYSNTDKSSILWTGDWLAERQPATITEEAPFLPGAHSNISGHTFLWKHSSSAVAAAQLVASQFFSAQAKLIFGAGPDERAGAVATTLTVGTNSG